MPATNQIPGLVQQLYAITEKLSRLFPGRSFTLDGHLVGSLGEVVAAYEYGVYLLPASSSGHDGCAPDGRMVQVKATQGKVVGLRSNPDYLIVLKLNSDGTFDEIYNGRGEPVWDVCGPVQKNGQRQVSLAKLRGLADRVSISERIPRARDG